MKFTRPFCLAAAAVGMFFLTPANQMPLAQGDVVEIGTGLSEQIDEHSFNFTGGGETSVGGAFTALADFDFDGGTGILYTATGVTLTTGEVFDFTVEVTAVSGINGEIFNIGPGLGDDRTDDTLFPPPLIGNNDRFQDQGTINLAVDVTSGNVNFDGFVNFGLNNLANNVGAGFNIDGVDYLRGQDADGNDSSVNGDNDPRFGIIITGGIIAQDNIDITFLDPRPDNTVEGTNLRGFALQFTSAIPEPSSMALMGLFGLGFASRRRK